MQVSVANSSRSGPVARSLERVLKTCVGNHDGTNGSSKVQIFSYWRDFNYLWEIDDPSSLATLSSTDVAVLFRAPDVVANVDLPEARKYLTPIDWAVWYCLKKHGDGDQGRIPRLIIVDQFRQDQRNQNSDADRFFSLFQYQTLANLPWISFVTLIPAPASPCCLVQLLRCLINAPAVGNKEIDLSMIRQLWQSFFLQPAIPSDNHALANLLGAGLLTGDFGDSPTRHALMKLMRTLDLLPSATTKETLEADSSIVADVANAMHSKLKGSARRALQLLLVDDDQRRHKWSDFVAGCLGLKQKAGSNECWTGKLGLFHAQLAATDSARKLLEATRSAIANNEYLRFNSDQPLDLLYLDLRLFERASLSTEAGFFREVIEQLRHLNRTRQPVPGDWPRVDQQELDRIDAWCNSAVDDSDAVSRSDTRYIDAITLLPRLAASVDPALPIALFSSTQRRRVAEILKPYGNIVTGFSKPALQLGQSTEQIMEWQFAFQQATARALELVHARRVRQFLLESEFSVYWRGHVEKPADDKSNQAWHVQLLLDETEKRNTLTVGGFLVIYPPGISPDKIDKRLHKTRPPIRRLSKDNRRKQIATILPRAVKVIEDEGGLVIPVDLSGVKSTASTAYSSWQQSSVFRDELVADNLHRELIRCLIELGLFVFARQILPESSRVEFSLHAPTRVLEVDDNEAQCLNRVFGVQSWVRKSDKKQVAGHLDTNSARPLLEEVFREYRGSTFGPKPVLARAFRLNDHPQSTEGKLVFALHFLADAWLSNRKSKRLANFRQLSIDGDYGREFACLLDAHRKLLHGDLPKAVAIAAGVLFELHRPNWPALSTAMNAILISLQDAVKTMSGSEMLLLSALLANAKRATLDERIIGRVTKVSSVDGSAEIRTNEGDFLATRDHCLEVLKVGQTVIFQPRRGNRVGNWLAHDVTIAQAGSQ